MTVSSGELSNSANSSSFELLAESYFLSELLQEMWFRRDQLVDVLHSQVDAFGYDIVLTTDSVTRHVQLKTRREGAKTARLSLNTRLETLPARNSCDRRFGWSLSERTLSPPHRSQILRRVYLARVDHRSS